jgi:tripartite-type tricarboxylate transporter receptor subunit TctC
MKAIRIGLVVVAALLVAQSAAAQVRYPDKPVRFIVGFTPGSATDITARLFAQKFAEAWGVPVTVENVPGAGGSVGGDRVAKSAPDGSTFYWGANGALTINPTLQANTTYDVQRDLAPVARLLVMASIFAVGNDVPAKSVAELFALAKAQPGKLSYASPGVGTPQHIAGELLKTLAGVDIVHVPYRGAVFTDVISGRVTMTLQNMGSVLPVVREGRLRGLAVTSLRRTPILPELPSMAESGFPGFEANHRQGVSAGGGGRRHARHPRQARGARPRHQRRRARRHGRHYQGRHRQVGKGDQGRRDQGSGVRAAVTYCAACRVGCHSMVTWLGWSATRASQSRTAGKRAKS